MRFGAPGMPAGWYDTITEPGGGSRSAFAVDGNTITVELAEQALSTPGTNTVALLINGADGYQLASWNFALMIEPVPGLEAPEATAYYNALTEQVAKTLANAKAAAQSAAEAAASAEAAQQVAQGAVGYYETPDALEQAHPTAKAGNWAIVGSTDTIWVWDLDTSAWKDSHQATDLSNYYTKPQTEANFYNKQQVQNLIAPIGYIFSWAPADNGPDLSTPAKVAEYFGFGTWAAYGTGQVLVGLDAGQTEFATVGQTGGEKAHKHDGGNLTATAFVKDDGTLVTVDGTHYDNTGAAKSWNAQRFLKGNEFNFGNEQTGSAIFVQGQTGEGTTLQPYITVYRWQRIA